MSNSKGWQNSIRHNLSLNKSFIRQKERDDGGRKGGTWSINPSVSIGSFKKVKANTTDNSFWEPDESVFGTPEQLGTDASENTRSLDLCTYKKDHNVPCIDNSALNRIEISENNLSDIEDSIYAESKEIEVNVKYDRVGLTGLDEFRRNSVEDFLEMNKAVLEPLPLKTKHNAPLSRPNKRNEQRLRKNKSSSEKEDELHSEMAVPLPPSSSMLFSKRCLSLTNAQQDESKESNKHFLDLDSLQRKQHFEGSMDYCEQYDPETVRHSGFAVITSNESEFPLCVESLCFLCGSEGKLN
jgi:hypothetical protein